MESLNIFNIKADPRSRVLGFSSPWENRKGATLSIGHSVTIHHSLILSFYCKHIRQRAGNPDYIHHSIGLTPVFVFVVK